jgi:hypothetical protein
MSVTKRPQNHNFEHKSSITFESFAAKATPFPPPTQSRCTATEHLAPCADNGRFRAPCEVLSLRLRHLCACSKRRKGKDCMGVGDCRLNRGDPTDGHPQANPRMAGGAPEHHMDRLGHRLGDCAGDPVLAASCWGIEGVACV